MPTHTNASQRYISAAVDAVEALPNTDESLAVAATVAASLAIAEAQLATAVATTIIAECLETWVDERAAAILSPNGSPTAAELADLERVAIWYDEYTEGTPPADD